MWSMVELVRSLGPELPMDRCLVRLQVSQIFPLLRETH